MNKPNTVFLMPDSENMGRKYTTYVLLALYLQSLESYGTSKMAEMAWAQIGHEKMGSGPFFNGPKLPNGLEFSPEIFGVFFP